MATKEGGNRIARWFRELSPFGAFITLLSVANIAVLVLVTLLIYQFILNPKQIIYATFWVIWAQGWISISIMLSTLKNRPGVLWIISGPIYLVWIARPEIQIAVLSCFIVVSFNFVTFYMDDTITAWYIMTTVACYSVVVFVSCLKQFLEKMEIKMERDVENDPHVLVFSPVLPGLSSANHASQGMHHVIRKASQRKKRAV